MIPNRKEVIGMPIKKDKWEMISWCCPNCGQLISGLPNAEGKIKASCQKCKTEMVLVHKGRRHDTLEIFAPATSSYPNNSIKA